MFIKVLGNILPINRPSDITPSKTGMVHTCGVHNYSLTVPELKSLWMEIYQKKKGDTIVRKKEDDTVCLFITLKCDGNKFQKNTCIKCLEANVVVPKHSIRVHDTFKQNRGKLSEPCNHVICAHKKQCGRHHPRHKIYAKASKLTSLLRANHRMQGFQVREVMNGLSLFQPWHDVRKIQEILQKVLHHLDTVKTTPKQSSVWACNPESGFYSGNERRDKTRLNLVKLLETFLTNVRGLEQKKDAASLMKPAGKKKIQKNTIMDDIQVQLEELEVLRHQLAELKGNVSMLNDLLDEKDRSIREKDILLNEKNTFICNQTNQIQNLETSLSDQTKRIQYLVDQMMIPNTLSCSQQYHDNDTTYSGPSSSVKSNINDRVWGQPLNMHW